MITPLTPPMSPAQTAPPAASQTPQSQYLTAVLKQLSAAQPATPGALGEDLLSQALLQHAQKAQQPQPYQSPVTSIEGMPANFNFGQPTSPTKPLSGLIGMGKNAMSGLASMFGGSGG